MISRAIDILVALSAFVLTAPLAGLAAIAITVESRGGALFRARRMGRNGRPFTMLKLRSMIAETGPRITVPDDARVTRVGRVLRRIHLDEWPQLWNVLRGDMSLVGPRPEDPSLVDLADSRWQRVLSVRPGITGPTQLVSAAREDALLRGDGSQASTVEIETRYRRDVLPEKLASDLGYVDRRSLATDLAVLARTLALPFRGAT